MSAQLVLPTAETHPSFLLQTPIPILLQADSTPTDRASFVNPADTPPLPSMILAGSILTKGQLLLFPEIQLRLPL